MIFTRNKYAHITAMALVAAFITIVILVVFAVTLSASNEGRPSPGGDWPGFRSGVQPGVAADGRYPTELDIESGQNVTWRTTIPGLGHSSPVVSGDYVFVTTAYSTAGSLTFKQRVDFLSSILQIFTAALLGFSLAADCILTTRTFPGRMFIWGRGLIVCTAAILSSMILQSGAELFQYQRCSIRSWLGSHLAASICVSIALSLTFDRRWLRRINTAMMVVIAVSAVALIPAKEHAYRHFGPQIFVVLAVGLLPLTFVAAISVIDTWQNSWNSRSPPSPISRSVWPVDHHHGDDYLPAASRVWCQCQLSGVG